LRRALVPCPPSTYSFAVDIVARIENEDRVKFAREAVHPVKQFSNKRSIEQRYDKQPWDNKGKLTKNDAN
jgi:hypothetical protein